MWWKWFPWRLVISRMARSHGFIDPMRVVSRLSRFAQPAEVTEPIELLRAGVVFHARGLINARAIQHNLDWVWPYWVERQFDPHDPAFVPRAFSFTHVNLTHRNWTAMGQPGSDWLPIVDPAGLVTPFYDGWSLDAWIVPSQGEPLYPSQGRDVTQTLDFTPENTSRSAPAHDTGNHRARDAHNGASSFAHGASRGANHARHGEDALAVATTAKDAVRGLSLHERGEVLWLDHGPCLQLTLRGAAASGGWLVVSARPANPEGISFIHELDAAEPATLRVNHQATVRFDREPTRIALSSYDRGDVAQQLTSMEPSEHVRCHVGLATGAALFPIEAGEETGVTVRVPLRDGPSQEPGVQQMRHASTQPSPQPWPATLADTCQLTVPDATTQRLFDAAVRSLILHCPGAVYPGPYTYRRFWFRDAAFILEALLTLNRPGQVRGVIEQFPRHQLKRGYFRSQQGEWDSNGEVLWLLKRYRDLSGMPLSQHLTSALERGARWLWRKRLSDDVDGKHAGLLPAGFSAEHFGPIDYYFWDDYWAVAGLDAAAALCRERGEARWATRCAAEAEHYRHAIDRAIERSHAYQQNAAIPASPYRRMDAGAIGALVASYPLQLVEPSDTRLMNTVDWLMAHCLVGGGFFQDMIHSGINAYLTLHLAQVLLRAGDPRWEALMRATGELASPTGQWPEAIHPRTGGGCMGDGQHTWAAAEWVRLVRNCFVREEGDRLILASGITEAWLSRNEVMWLGPTATPYGPVTVTVEPGEETVRVGWEATWRHQPAALEVRLPGGAGETVEPGVGEARVPRHPEAGLTTRAGP